VLFEEFSQIGADTILGAVFPALCQAILACTLLSFTIRRRAKNATGNSVSRTAFAFRKRESRIMSRDIQWARISGVVGAGVARADTAREFQAAASRQVDAAAYAIEGMLKELSAVMQLPATSMAEVIPLASAPVPVAKRRETLAA
jgi:hypothetical protein